MTDEAFPTPESRVRHHPTAAGSLAVESALEGAGIAPVVSAESRLQYIDRSASTPVVVAETRHTSKELPRSFAEMRPEPKTAKIMIDERAGIELRQSSTDHHQDGIAFNPDTNTTVVTDGLGGIGPDGEAKNHFGFALAHATSELTDISTLADPVVVESVVARAKDILQDELGIIVDGVRGRIKQKMFDGPMAATVAAVQRIEDTDTWRVITFGDSSVVALDKDGKITRGFGEAYQQISAGNVGADGTAADAPMSSVVGISYDDYRGTVRYGGEASRSKFGAEFTEVTLAEGEKLVIVSDAYVQKTPPSQLEHDAAEPAENWKVRAPRYGDDTTMAIVRR